MVLSLLLWKCYFCGSFLILRLYSNFCNAPVNFSPRRGMHENRILGMESQGFVIVRNIWQCLCSRSAHLTLVICFVYSLCAKLSTSLSLLALPQQNSLYKRKTILFFKSYCLQHSLPPPRDQLGPSWEYGDFMAPVPTSPTFPTPRVCGLCCFPFHWFLWRSVVVGGDTLAMSNALMEGRKVGSSHSLRFQVISTLLVQVV